jgi:transcriptional regulator with XRE-family HTH domain
MTAEDVASRAYVSRATYNRIERGDPTVQLGLYASVAFILEQNIGDLLTFDPELIAADSLIPKRSRRLGQERAAPKGFKSIEDWCTYMSTAITSRGRGEVTSEQLLTIWQAQSGRCAVTSLPLDVTNANIRRPSVDRIDSSLGYIPSNLQIVMLALNYMKNDSAQEDITALLSDIRSVKR